MKINKRHAYFRNVKDKFESALVQVLREKPYLIGVSSLINKYESYSIPTAGVTITPDGELKLLYNSKFINKLKYSEAVAVIEHELLHVALLHITYRKESLEKPEENPDVFNLAADAAINCFISGLPTGCVTPEALGLETKQALEVYYNKLLKEKKKIQSLLEKFMQIDIHDWNNKCEKDNDKNSNNSCNKEDKNGKGDKEDKNGKGDKDKEKTKQKISDAVREKVKQMISQKLNELRKTNMWGSVPGELRQQIDTLLESVVNWKREIKIFGQNIVSTELTFTRKRVNRRIDDFPGFTKEYKCNLMVWIDTSGSVGNDDLEIFLAEIKRLSKFSQIDIGQFDHGIEELQSVEIFKKKKEFVGRGGTSFQEPFNFMLDRKYRKQICNQFKFRPKKKYSGTIILTDGCAPAPVIKHKIKTLWCLLPNCKPPDGYEGKSVTIERFAEKK